MLRNCIRGFLITVGVTTGAAAGGKGHFRIGPSQVAVALSGAGMHVMSRHVQLAVDVWSTSPNPVMDVAGAQELPDKNHALVRIECHDSHQCRPFYATIAWTGPLSISGNLSQSKSSAQPNSYSSPVMRMGDHATLVVDGPRLHMEIAVIAMQNGAVGQVIQLATPDRKHFFRGQIVSDSVLTGVL